VEGRARAREDVDLSWAYEAGRALDRGAQPIPGKPIGEGAGSARADATVDTGNDGRGQIRENVTNEPNFAENVVDCQTREVIDVTANSGANSGLDKAAETRDLGPTSGGSRVESGDPKSVLEWADRAGPEGAPHPDLLPASAAREDVDGDRATSRTANRKSHPPQADDGPKSKGRGAGRPSLTPGLIRDGALLTRVIEGTKASSRSLAIEEQLIGQILASSPTVAEIVRRQLPRAP
jgi:hypothetical protein